MVAVLKEGEVGWKEGDGGLRGWRVRPEGEGLEWTEVGEVLRGEEGWRGVGALQEAVGEVLIPPFPCLAL